VQAGEALALQVADACDPPPLPSSLDERITSALADAPSPIPFGELRSKCHVRAATLYERLAALTQTAVSSSLGTVAIASSAPDADFSDNHDERKPLH
jgi:hypothetical protein